MLKTLKVLDPGRGRRRLVAALIVVVLVAPTSRRDAGRAWAAEPPTVAVFAAASLTSAFQAAAGAFEKTPGGVTVQLNFAGSPTLVQQIQEGAPADVFAAADETNMRKLVESGAVAGEPVVFARNSLQIAVAPHNPKHLTGLADLAKPGLVIALCGPSVPCGRYAVEVFGKAGVPVPTASQEPDVKAVVTKVALGEADAGVVYVTDIRTAGDKVEGVSIPESSNVVARYPIATLKSASNTAGGTTFVAFILSPEGQRILATFGFLPR